MKPLLLLLTPLIALCGVTAWVSGGVRFSADVGDLVLPLAMLTLASSLLPKTKVWRHVRALGLAIVVTATILTPYARNFWTLAQATGAMLLTMIVLYGLILYELTVDTSWVAGSARRVAWLAVPAALSAVSLFADGNAVLALQLGTVVGATILVWPWLRREQQAVRAYIPTFSVIYATMLLVGFFYGGMELMTLIVLMSVLPFCPPLVTRGQRCEA